MEVAVKMTCELWLCDQMVSASRDHVLPTLPPVYASMQVCKCASMQVCKYASMQAYKYASMQVGKYAPTNKQTI